MTGEQPDVIRIKETRGVYVTSSFNLTALRTRDIGRSIVVVLDKANNIINTRGKVKQQSDRIRMLSAFMVGRTCQVASRHLPPPSLQF